MPFCRTLTVKELQELDEWLRVKQIQLDNRTLRDLSNVVTVARLFRQLEPKLVDMGNYSSNSSLSLKLDNWERFNLKVLRKLGLRISREELQKFAMGSPSAVRSLLFYLMSVESEAPKPQLCLERSTSSSKQCKICPSAHQRTLKAMPWAMSLKSEVPYKRYELLTKLNRKKEKYLNSISHKIQYLESLILVKDERISYLTDRLAKLSK